MTVYGWSRVKRENSGFNVARSSGLGGWCGRHASAPNRKPCLLAPSSSCTVFPAPPSLCLPLPRPGLDLKVKPATLRLDREPGAMFARASRRCGSRKVEDDRLYTEVNTVFSADDVPFCIFNMCFSFSRFFFLR